MTASAAQLPSLVEGREFREAMALLAAPVTVVTAVDSTGRRRGFTASAVSSVSLDPPLLLVGLAHTSSCYATLTGTDEFVVNVLGAEHRDVARGFAQQTGDRFAHGTFAEWPGTALPYLPDARVAIRCSRHEIVQAGDHALLLGALTGIRTGSPGKALVWYGRAFHTPG
jgi:flavin reductase ActVB